MSERCPVCGKQFEVLYPTIWAYKRGSRYICSWKCLREHDAGTRRDDMNLNEKSRKAVEIALEDGNPMEYLQKTGSKNPSAAWCSIRNQLEDKEPETYAKLPARLKKKAAEAPKKPKTQKREKPEAKKAEAQRREPEKVGPGTIEGMIIREVEGTFGRYRFTENGRGRFIDFETKEGLETISYTVEQWREFMEEHRKAARILGVEI